jgi:hypothetical protein
VDQRNSIILSVGVWHAIYWSSLRSCRHMQTCTNIHLLPRETTTKNAILNNALFPIFYRLSAPLRMQLHRHSKANLHKLNRCPNNGYGMSSRAEQDAVFSGHKSSRGGKYNSDKRQHHTNHALALKTSKLLVVYAERIGRCACINRPMITWPRIQ